MGKTFANCDNCGNEIEITEAIKYATCNSCNQSLEIVRTSTSIYTQRKESGNNSTVNANKQEIDRAEIHRQIESLDRKWNNEIPNFMIKGTLPNTAVFLDYFLGIFVIGFGAVWAIVLSPDLLSFVGIFFAGIELESDKSAQQKKKISGDEGEI